MPHISKDVNGNKTIKFTGNELKAINPNAKRGFSIQTNGNLPETHRNGICQQTINEVVSYINCFGTNNQKVNCGLV